MVETFMGCEGLSHLRERQTLTHPSKRRGCVSVSPGLRRETFTGPVKVVKVSGFMDANPCPDFPQPTGTDRGHQ